MVELWIEIKGSRERERVGRRGPSRSLGGMPKKSENRVECRDIEGESHWLNEVRLSAR